MSFDVDVEARLGDFALAVRFTAVAGLTALFGPSGAGKTSVLNMIAGVLKPGRGRIAEVLPGMGCRWAANGGLGKSSMRNLVARAGRMSGRS